MWEIRPSTLRNNPGNRPRIYMGYNTAYLGHSHPASTYWYLQAVPELLTAASQRLGVEQASGELP